MRNSRKNIYALYDGERNVCDGTVDEIARKVGVKRKTVAFYLSPSYRKRRSAKKVLVLIEEHE